MAISRGQLVKELEPGLNALFALEGALVAPAAGGGCPHPDLMGLAARGVGRLVVVPLLHTVDVQEQAGRRAPGGGQVVPCSCRRGGGAGGGPGSVQFCAPGLELPAVQGEGRQAPGAPPVGLVLDDDVPVGLAGPRLDPGLDGVGLVGRAQVGEVPCLDDVVAAVEVKCLVEGVGGGWTG